jgi:hypothetical protein
MIEVGPLQSSEINPAKSGAGRSGKSSRGLSVAVGGRERVKFNTNVKGSGQECPLHTRA